MIDRGIRGPQTERSRTGFLVDLNGSLVSLDTNNFTDEQIVSNMALSALKVSMDELRRGYWGGARGTPTNSYMAQPIMFSATTTGPETEKIEP